MVLAGSRCILSDALPMVVCPSWYRSVHDLRRGNRARLRASSWIRLPVNRNDRWSMVCWPDNDGRSSMLENDSRSELRDTSLPQKTPTR